MTGPRRKKLTERLAHLPPAVAEANEVGVVMCELLADMLDALTGGAEQDQAATSEGRNTAAAGTTPAAAVPSGDGTEGDEKEGASVQLQEPDVPPVDVDEVPDTGNDTRDRAVAEQATPAGKSGRPPARKATAKKTAAAKKAAPAAEDKE